MPIKLPYESVNKYWFTAMRFILPTKDKDLHAYRLLDVHFLFSKEDITRIVNGLTKWEKSDKRCCVWKYAGYASRPYCAAGFGLNISISSKGEVPCINFDFLMFELTKLVSPRLCNGLQGIKYGDDERLLYLLLEHYFSDPNTRTLDRDAVYFIDSFDRSGMFIGKSAINQAATAIRHNAVSILITATQYPYRIMDPYITVLLFKVRNI